MHPPGSHPSISSMQSSPERISLNYLGITIDKSLTFKSHIANVRSHGRQAMAWLFPLLCRQSKLSPKNKLTLYKAIIRITMLYSSLVWGQSAKSHIKSLQNKILRMVFHVPWFLTNALLHHDTDLPTIKSYMQSLAKKHLEYEPHLDSPTLLRSYPKMITTHNPLSVDL